jgi:UDP-N-acetylglucosamine 2-epimerase (non-hydrolysing)
VEQGTNVLAGTTRDGILAAVEEAMAKRDRARVPPLWDGESGRRIADILSRALQAS